MRRRYPQKMVELLALVPAGSGFFEKRVVEHSVATPKLVSLLAAYQSQSDSSQNREGLTKKANSMGDYILDVMASSI